MSWERVAAESTNLMILKVAPVPVPLVTATEALTVLAVPAPESVQAVIIPLALTVETVT